MAAETSVSRWIVEHAILASAKGMPWANEAEAQISLRGNRYARSAEKQAVVLLNTK